VLSAGRGERLRPLTEVLPKPAIPVLGRPIIVQILQQLAAAGIEEATLNLHHLPQVLIDLIGDGSDFGLPRIHFSVEETLLGTAGGIRKASPYLRDAGPILVMNADCLSEIDLGGVVAAHRESGMLATLVLTAHRPGYSAVEIDDERRITGFALGSGNGVDQGLMFTGVHIIEEELLDLIPEEGPSDIVRDVYLDLVKQRRVGAFIHDGFWWEFGSPALYLEGSLRLLELSLARRQLVTGHDPVRRLDRAIVAVGPGAKVDGKARLGGRAALGFASYVSGGAMVEDSIVMPEAWVGPDCRLRNTVIAQGVEVAAGTELEAAFVCADTVPGAEYGPSVRRANGMLIQPIVSG